MGKKIGKIGVILIAIGVLCLISVSAINVLPEKNHDDIPYSPLFNLRTQQAIDNDMDFSVEYITKELNDTLYEFNFDYIEERTGYQQMQDDNTWDPPDWPTQKTCSWCSSTSDMCFLTSFTCADTCSTCSGTCQSCQYTCYNTCKCLYDDH